MCHGTMLAWCSISLSTIASAGPRFEPPHERATRFMASVAFLVKTISSALGAETNRATSARARSICSVAAAAIS